VPGTVKGMVRVAVKARGRGRKPASGSAGARVVTAVGIIMLMLTATIVSTVKRATTFPSGQPTPLPPRRGGGKGGGWQWPKKVAQGEGKPAAAGGAPKGGAPAGKGNLVSGAKWFSQANGEVGDPPDVEMGEPAEVAGAAGEAASVEEQRVKDDIASSRAMAKHCRQAAKRLKELAVSSSLGDALADEIGRQIALAEQHEQTTGQQLEQQRAELPNEVQLEKKQGLLKSLKAGAAKANEEHRGLLAKAEALQAEILAKSEQAARLEEKAVAIDREIQEVFRKMGDGGVAAPPQVQPVRPPVGGADEFTEAEKLEMYAARTARAEAALWTQRQQHAAAVQAAVVEEQNRAALARAAEGDALRVAEERAARDAHQAGPRPEGQAEQVGGGSTRSAAAAGLDPALSELTASNLRRRVSAKTPGVVPKESEGEEGTQDEGTGF
jgi:hypothetical protein